jgi:hypothetical protein
VVTTGRIQVGQRVWVVDPDAKGGRVPGVIASIRDDFLNGGGFVVRLDGQKKVLTCSVDGRGVQWDFAAD